MVPTVAFLTHFVLFMIIIQVWMSLHIYPWRAICAGGVGDRPALALYAEKLDFIKVVSLHLIGSFWGDTTHFEMVSEHVWSRAVLVVAHFAHVVSVVITVQVWISIHVCPW